MNPRAASAQVELARLDLATGRVNTSVEHARGAVKNEPTNLAAQVALIRSLIGSKDLAGAKAVLDPLLAANPNEPILYVQRGLLASASNDLPGARRAFARALELNPRLVEAISGLAALELASGDFAAARSRVEAAVKALPDSPEVHIIAARTYAASKDLVGAERELKRALELNPDLLPAYTMLGQLTSRRDGSPMRDGSSKPFQCGTPSPCSR